ncbi:hypothetical protein ACFVDI_14185 [Nocardioides sp. NPDC057767]|uniref:hypothetical protein n=1 Tax=unclassified Nocardioides TaxID=2615069 RepID=UPI00366D1BB3
MKPATAAWLRSRLAARIRPDDDSPAAEAEREARFETIDRELAKTQPPSDDHARRLAALLGLRAGGDADAA